MSLAADEAELLEPIKHAGHGASAQLGEFRELGRAEGTVQLKQVQGLALACAHADLCGDLLVEEHNCRNDFRQLLCNPLRGLGRGLAHQTSPRYPLGSPNNTKTKMPAQTNDLEAEPTC